MSRGFVKEDDQEEAPFIPPRAPIPEGVQNYVTANGLKLLLQEREDLEAERRTIIEGEFSDHDRRHALAVINGKLDLLNERIGSARVVEQPDGSPSEVRFGVTVTYRQHRKGGTPMEQTFTIVGVDEADVKQGKIAFTAPIAKAMIGARAGEKVPFRLGSEIQQLEILKIARDRSL
jgi:transcription elongation factor GreB